jgi:hypothetical protein
VHNSKDVLTKLGTLQDYTARIQGNPVGTLAKQSGATAYSVAVYDDCPMCPEVERGHPSVEDELFRPGGFVLALIGLVLLVMWLLGFVAFHVTSGVIHVLLVLALISIIVHFLRGRTVA